MKNWMKTLTVMMALTVSFAAHAQVDPTMDQELGEGKIEAAQADQSGSPIDMAKKAINDQMTKIHALTNAINAKVTQTTTADGEDTAEAITARDALKLDADAGAQVQLLKQNKDASITDYQLLEGNLLATTIELQNMAQ